MAGNKVIMQFVGDEKDLVRAMNRIEGKSSTFGSKIGAVGKAAALGLAGVGVAAVGMGLSFAKAAEESQAVTRQTDAVLRSMGAAAWTTADAVAGLSEKLSLQTGIDDELIQSGQNVLLTFANVRNEVGKGNAIFDRATTAALDMSVALGQDMQSSVTQLGKALNDPIAGISALNRVGVQFTEQQKEQIATLVESGDVLGAQKVIMAEVERQFAGSAEAQATTSQKLATLWGNLQETLGAKLLPVMEAVSAWITKTGVPALEDLSGWVEREGVPRLRDFGKWLGQNILPALQVLGRFIVGTVVPGLIALGTWLSENQRVLAALAIGVTAMLVPAFVAWAISAGAAAIATIAAAAPLILIGLAVAALAYLIITHWDTIKTATITAFNAVKDAIAAAFNWVKENWPLLLAILTGPIGIAVYTIIQHWETIKSGFTAVKDWIWNTMASIVGFFTGLPGRLAAAAGDLWGFIVSGFKGAINSVIGLWNGISFPSFTVGGWDPPGPGPTIPSMTVGGWSLPDIPYLHSGGEFRAPAGQREGLAMLLDGERVSRPGQGGDVTVHLHVGNVLASERDLVKIIRDEIGRGGFGGAFT